MRSSIEPSTRARRRYRWVFYCALVLLLGVQLYYVFGSSVHSEATRLEKEYLDVQAQRIAAQDPDNKTPPAVPVEILGQQEGVIWGELSAHNDLSEILIDVWSYPFSAFLANYEPGGAQDEWAKYIETKSSLATLKVILDFLAAYVLPALYGLLGACAFVLRKLSHEVGELQFASTREAQYSLRLNIGVLAGLAVGWFIKPDQEASVLANLSPLALAFVAGYASDLLFAALDRIVQAFSGSSDATGHERADDIGREHVGVVPAARAGGAAHERTVVREAETSSGDRGPPMPGTDVPSPQQGEAEQPRAA